MESWYAVCIKKKCTNIKVCDKVTIFSYVCLLGCKKIGICVFHMATKMTELYANQPIFQPAVSNFYCKHLIFVTLSAKVPQEIH